jgi:hypothetical protein
MDSKNRLSRNCTIIADILLRHKLAYLKDVAWNIISHTKYLIFILLLGISDFMIANYAFNLMQATERTSVLVALFAFNSVIITGLGIMYQVEAKNKGDARFKVHRQRKVKYEKLLEQIKNDLSDVLVSKAIENTLLLGASQTITDDQKNKLKKDIDLMFDLMLYGSPELIEKRIKQREIQIKNDPIAGRLKTINSIEDKKKCERTLIQERNSMYNLIQLYELILQMRNEIGFEDRSISVRKLLSIHFDNIYDSHFDRYFIDMNVPLC